MFSTVPFGMTAQEMNGWLNYGGGIELWREPLPVPTTQHGAGTSPILAGSAWASRRARNSSRVVISVIRLIWVGIGARGISRRVEFTDIPFDIGPYFSLFAAGNPEIGRSR